MWTRWHKWCTKTRAALEGVSRALPNHTDHENHSGTYSRKDPLLKCNHHSLLRAPTPVGKANVTAASNCAGPQQGLKPQSCKSKQFLGEHLLAKLIHIFLGELLHTTLHMSRSRKFWESTFLLAMLVTRMPKNLVFFPRNVLLFSDYTGAMAESQNAEHPDAKFSCNFHW